MSILTISGSIRKGSTTVAFLEQIETSFPTFNLDHLSIAALPLFHPDAYDNPMDRSVDRFKEKINEVNGIIIASPEYIYGIPAVLKNALEWTTQTGEFDNKKVLAITFTPHHPRGEKATVNLLNSLKALNSKVVGSMSVYHTDINDEGQIRPEVKEMIHEGLKLLA